MFDCKQLTNLESQANEPLVVGRCLSTLDRTPETGRRHVLPVSRTASVRAGEDPR